LILVDPPIWSKKWHGKDNDVYKMVEQTTPTRRDIWKSRQEASAWLKSKIARGWDQRVFAKYVVSSVPVFAIFTEIQTIAVGAWRSFFAHCRLPRQTRRNPDNP
jgi:hypothetical protein